MKKNVEAIAPKRSKGQRINAFTSYKIRKWDSPAWPFPPFSLKRNAHCSTQAQSPWVSLAITTET